MPTSRRSTACCATLKLRPGDSFSRALHNADYGCYWRLQQGVGSPASGRSQATAGNAPAGFTGWLSALRLLHGMKKFLTLAKASAFVPHSRKSPGRTYESLLSIAFNAC